MSDRDGDAASSMSPSLCYVPALQHRVDGLSDRGLWNRKGSMGMKSPLWGKTRPRGKLQSKNVRRGDMAREEEGERTGESGRERLDLA